MSKVWSQDGEIHQIRVGRPATESDRVPLLALSQMCDGGRMKLLRKLYHRWRTRHGWQRVDTGELPEPREGWWDA